MSQILWFMKTQERYTLIQEELLMEELYTSNNSMNLSLILLLGSLSLYFLYLVSCSLFSSFYCFGQNPRRKLRRQQLFLSQEKENLKENLFFEKSMMIRLTLRSLLKMKFEKSSKLNSEESENLQKKRDFDNLNLKNNKRRSSRRELFI